MFAPPSINKVEVCLTCTYNELSLLRPNTWGELTTRVMLSITEGTLGSSASQKTKEPCVLDVDGDTKEGVGSHGNSNGFVGERGQAGLLIMWSMMDPAVKAGDSGGGSAGGRTGTCVVETTAAARVCVCVNLTSGGERSLATPAYQGRLALIFLPLGAAVNKIKSATLALPNT
jgi:hypothetical protein